MSSLTQKAIPTKSLASENAYGKSKSPSPLPIRESKTLDIEGFEHTSFDFEVNSHSHKKKAVNQTKLIQTWGGVMNFTLLKSDCPICGGFRNGKKKHDCKRSGELIHCFSHNDPPLGFALVGQSAIGQSLYAPAKGKDFDPEKHRAELAKLRAEHQAKAEQRRQSLPTIPERHQEILKFKAELTEAQNTDLLIRGLFQEEIDFALANHWLFACKGGFGIAAIDPVTGLLCGAQRAKDDRSPKYDWGIFTGKNQLKETNENPLAVWVYPDFDPTQPYEIKFTEGFLKSLIRALMEWRKNPQIIIIGAAGGIFGKNSLKRVLSVYDAAAKQTLLPDKNSQNLKKLNIYSAYQGLFNSVPNVMFADWGQWRDETRGDCDETEGTKSFNRYKRRSPKDFLRFFKFEETRKQARERLKISDNLTPDIEISHEEFYALDAAKFEQLTGNSRDVELVAQRGLGKTEKSAEIMKSWGRAIAPFHRKALAQNGGAKLGFAYRTDCDVMKDQLIGSGGFVEKIAYCNEAYLGLMRPINALLKAGAGVFCDELDQQIKNLLLSSTHGKKGQRKLHWDGFWNNLTRAEKTLGVSADITDFEVNLQHQKIGRKPFVIKVTEQKKPTENYVFENSAQWWAKFLQFRSEGKRLLILCTRKSDTEFFKFAFGAIAINADNANEYRDFLTNPDPWLLREKPQLMVVSPILGTGFSIKSDSFDVVMGFFHADNIPAKDLMQFLDRYRPNVPRYIWCAETNSRYDQLTPDAIFKARMARAKASKTIENESAFIDQDDPYFYYKAESNWSLAHLRADLLARLERDCETVHYVLDELSKEEKDMINRQVTDLRKAFNDADYLKTQDAENLTRDEYLALLEKEENLTEKQRRAIAKFEIADWGMMTPDQLDVDYIKRDRRGKKRKALEKLEQQAFPKIAESLDKLSLEKQIKHGVSQQDLTHNLLRVRALEDLGIGKVLDFVLNGGVWHSEHPIVKETAEVLRSKRGELALMGVSLTCGKNANDNAYFGSLLKGFGLTTKRNRRRETYQLCNEDLELTKRDLIARLPRNTEKFGELTVEPENQWVSGIYGGSIPFENINKQGSGSVENSLLDLVFDASTSPPKPEKIPLSTPMATAIAPNLPTPDDPPEKMEPSVLESEVKSIAPKYQKGDRVWFLRAGEWIKGTVQAVYQGIVTQYRCLDSTGAEFFIEEASMNPI
jgi:hypothetical protein